MSAGNDSLRSRTCSFPPLSLTHSPCKLVLPSRLQTLMSLLYMMCELMLSGPSRDCCPPNFVINRVICNLHQLNASSSHYVIMVSFLSQDNDVRIIIGQFDENLASKVFCCVSVHTLPFWS